MATALFVIKLTAPDADAELNTAVIIVSETITNELAVIPPKVTAVTSVNLIPLIVMVSPVAPLAGVKL